MPKVSVYDDRIQGTVLIFAVIQDYRNIALKKGNFILVKFLETVIIIKNIFHNIKPFRTCVYGSERLSCPSKFFNKLEFKYLIFDDCSQHITSGNFLRLSFHPCSKGLYDLLAFLRFHNDFGREGIYLVDVHMLLEP